MEQRQKDSSKTRGLHKAADISYNEQAGGLKQVGPILGKLKRLFTVDAKKDLPAGAKSGSVIAFYNPTAATAWLILHNEAGAPPTPAAGQEDSIALKPNDYTVLALGKDVNSVISDVTTVVAFLIEDDSVLK